MSVIQQLAIAVAPYIPTTSFDQIVVGKVADAVCGGVTVAKWDTFDSIYPGVKNTALDSDCKKNFMLTASDRNYFIDTIVNEIADISIQKVQKDVTVAKALYSPVTVSANSFTDDYSNFVNAVSDNVSKKINDLLPILNFNSNFHANKFAAKESFSNPAFFSYPADIPLSALSNFINADLRKSFISISSKKDTKKVIESLSQSVVNAVNSAFIFSHIEVSNIEALLTADKTALKSTPRRVFDSYILKALTDNSYMDSSLNVVNLMNSKSTESVCKLYNSVFSELFNADNTIITKADMKSMLVSLSPYSQDSLIDYSTNTKTNDLFTCVDDATKTFADCSSLALTACEELLASTTGDLLNTSEASFSSKALIPLSRGILTSSADLKKTTELSNMAPGIEQSPDDYNINPLLVAVIVLGFIGTTLLCGTIWGLYSRFISNKRNTTEKSSTSPSKNLAVVERGMTDQLVSLHIDDTEKDKKRNQK